MITNKNMSNEEIVEKLIEKSMDLLSQTSVDKRDIERFNNIREEILLRMDKNKELQIMTPNNPQWKQFNDILAQRIFHETCDAETMTHTKNILKKFFPKTDVDKTLQYFKEKGAYCDCEILYNL